MSKHIGFQNKLSSFQIIILGFAGVIVLGALLLMLPISTQNGAVTPFSKTLFTATSAVCVTGLVVFDTASYWSGFGQLIILIMIQIGGLGVISVASFLSMLAGRKISLMQRQTHAECFISTTDGRYCKTDTIYLSGVFCNRRNWGVIVNACIYDEVWNKRNLDGGFSFCFGIL